ncbi:MAG TPA: AraC family transcriptional regulator [Armatimonadota bacterium]|nr:AraC family transcriptional regulator [Armatimonadota bacterium]
MLTLPPGMMNSPNLNGYFPHDDPNLPHHISMGWERRTSPTYSWWGLQRPDGPTCIFQYTLAGHGVLERAEERYVLKAGQAFLVTVPDDHHYYLPAGWEPWEFVFICFDGGDVIRHVHWVLDQQGPVFDLPIDHPVLGCYSELLSAMQAQQCPNVEMIAECLYRFILRLRRSVKHPPTLPRQEVTRVLQYVAQHYAEDINIENLAEASGLSRAHFSRIFHHEMGTSPLQYLLDIRLQRATCLLRSTQFSLEEISAQCGFASANYFGKVFRKHYATTPMAYRNEEITSSHVRDATI